jgi:hypothetical protein
MNRLLCATDLLPASESAVDRAGVLAQELNARLSLLHVVSPTGSRQIWSSLFRSPSCAWTRVSARRCGAAGGCPACCFERAIPRD